MSKQIDELTSSYDIEGEEWRRKVGELVEVNQALTKQLRAAALLEKERGEDTLNRITSGLLETSSKIAKENADHHINSPSPSSKAVVEKLNKKVMTLRSELGDAMGRLEGMDSLRSKLRDVNQNNRELERYYKCSILKTIL